MTTTFIPLNVGAADHCQTVSGPPIGLIDKGSRQSGKVATHVIGDWVIRESSEPFRRTENHPSSSSSSSSIGRMSLQEKPTILPDSGVSALSSPNSVNQWNVSVHLIIESLVENSRLKWSFLNASDGHVCIAGAIFDDDQEQMERMLYFYRIESRAIRWSYFLIFFCFSKVVTECSTNEAFVDFLLFV